MKFPKNSLGIVYGASGGTRHIKDAVKSAKSVKRFHPEVSMTLFTNHAPSYLQGKGCDVSCFNSVRLFGDQHSRNKFDAMRGSPYYKTLYLDNDTVVKRPVVTDMLRVLDNFDMALTHAPLQRIVTPLPEIPPCFTELNGGVVLYRKNKKVLELLRQWEENWKNKTIETRKGHKDQPYLRKLIWESDLRIYILPPEYNVRVKTAKKIYIHHRKGISL